MRPSLVAVVCVLAVAGGVPAQATQAPQRTGHGLYLQHCSPCHGENGRGDGPNVSLFLAAPSDLRSGLIAKYTTDALVDKIVNGRRLPLALNVAALRAHSREVGAVERHIKRLPSLDWVAVENGWAIFAERCAACHGPFGTPLQPLPAGVRSPRDLSSQQFQESVSDDQLVSAVRHGRKGMPALVPRLRVEEAEHVTAFVRILGPGFQSYSTLCGQCHGDDGVGIGNFDETVGAPAVTFDQDYFRHVPPDRLRQSIWHMLRREKPAMPHFRGVLTKAEARSIVEYLETLPVDPKTE